VDELSGRLIGGKPFSRGALYLILRNRIYRGEIVHNGQSHPGKHPPIVDQPLWDAVQEQLASNTAERASDARARRPSLLTGMLFDSDGNRMTPRHSAKKDTRYHYYVSRPLIIKDHAESSAGRRTPAAENEQLVTSQLDPGDRPGLDRKSLSRRSTESPSHERMGSPAVCHRL
jgi:site-specific DNA recombinase